jgi:hypothetical protein
MTTTTDANETRYQGWTNYETWSVNLILRQDADGDDHAHDLAQDAYEAAEADGMFTRLEMAVVDLMNRIKAWVEDGNPLADDATLYSQLLQAAIDSANFREIAKEWLTPEIIADVEAAEYGDD